MIIGKKFCQTLLNGKQDIPKNIIFCDNKFKKCNERLQSKNEASFFKNYTLLLVLLSVNCNIDIAIKSISWKNSNPITKPCLKPDYTIRFRWSIFLNDQLKKLWPFLRNFLISAFYFMGTYYMHFLFFTCKIKSGLIRFNITDWQNFHNTTPAIQGIV